MVKHSQSEAVASKEGNGPIILRDGFVYFAIGFLDEGFEHNKLVWNVA